MRPAADGRRAGVTTLRTGALAATLLIHAAVLALDLIDPDRPEAEAMVATAGE